MCREQYKISIVIPIYNCEVYLEQCLNSVINQTVKEKEIICIDDGSTDDSISILEKYSELYSEIVILRQRNQGAGKARNYGINNARGKYIAFLDADDYYLDCNALMEMVNECEKTGLKICGSLRKTLNEGSVIEDSMFQNLFGEKEGSKQLCYKDSQMDYNYQSFIFSKDLLVDNNIFFPNYRRFEDPPFFVKAMATAEKFAVISKYLYCYRQPILGTRFDESKVLDLLQGIEDDLRFSKENMYKKLYVKTVDRLEYEFCDLIINYASQNEKIILKLFELNRICDGDTIRPLKKICSMIGKATCEYENILVSDILNQKEIVIYGAGNFGKKFLEFLRKKGLEKCVDKFVVSKQVGKNKTVQGIPIVGLDDWNEADVPIYIATAGLAQKEIESMLQNRGFENFVLLNTHFLDSL